MCRSRENTPPLPSLHFGDLVKDGSCDVLLALQLLRENAVLCYESHGELRIARKIYKKNLEFIGDDVEEIVSLKCIYDVDAVDRKSVV